MVDVFLCNYKKKRIFIDKKKRIFIDMKELRLIIRRIISEAVASDVEKTYSIKYNVATKNYVLYKTFLDDSDYYEPVKKTVKIKDLGKDPEKAQDLAFKLVKRKLEIPGVKTGGKASLGDSTISFGLLFHFCSLSQPSYHTNFCVCL